MLKRLLDIVTSSIGLLVLAIPFAAISAAVSLDSPGSPLFKQVRLGKDGEPFELLKFRTMCQSSGCGAKITVGDDPRITRVGAFIRKYKLDELPQLFNVLVGDMSLVGPRPEVAEYGYVYAEQDEVRTVQPGITDAASIKYRNESEILANAHDPDAFYRQVLLWDKTCANVAYVRTRSFLGDIKLILETVYLVFLHREEAPSGVRGALPDGL